MTWDMLRKFAETELRPQARKTESDGRPSDELLEKIKVFRSYFPYYS